MKKTICILLSLCLLMFVSAVTAQSTGCTDAAGGSIPCPDRDGDGVQDSEDRCVSDVGPASNGGCPATGQTGSGGGDGDADGDGIADSSDQCATIAGTSDFGGCPGPTPTPIPDSDADGEHDLIDRCPNQPGPATNTGCPIDTTAPSDPLATAQPTEASPVRPVFPESEECLLVSTTSNNLKQIGIAYAPNIGSIPAGEFVPASAAVINAAGEKWFYIEPRGYLPASSVLTNGKCEDLPTETIGSLVFPANEGPCQVVASIVVNVRALPSLNAAVASTLTPGQFYPVMGAVLNVEGTWYRVETGWVSASVVVIDGQCAPAVLMLEASVFTIDQAEHDAAMGGIAPEEECFELFNGLNFCQFVLTATANDDDGATEGWSPGGTNVCGIGIGGLDCTLIEFNSYTPEECEPLVCGGGDPEPPQPLPEPYPDGPHPLVQEDDGLDLSGANTETAILCKTLFDRLALPSTGEGSPYFTEELPGGVAFGLNLPPLEPQPCLVDVYVVREGGAANGQIPVDRLTLQIEFPAAAADYYLKIDTIEGESESPAAPTVTRYDRVRIGPDGVCIMVTHGDFKWCPGETAAQ